MSAAPHWRAARGAMAPDGAWGRAALAGAVAAATGRVTRTGGGVARSRHWLRDRAMAAPACPCAGKGRGAEHARGGAGRSAAGGAVRGAAGASGECGWSAAVSRGCGALCVSVGRGGLRRAAGNTRASPGCGVYRERLPFGKAASPSRRAGSGGRPASPRPAGDVPLPARLHRAPRGLWGALVEVDPPCVCGDGRVWGGFPFFDKKTPFRRCVTFPAAPGEPCAGFPPL